MALISNVDMQNLMKIGKSATKLLRIFDFQNGDRPPSWIWYESYGTTHDLCLMVLTAS